LAQVVQHLVLVQEMLAAIVCFQLSLQLAVAAVDTLAALDKTAVQAAAVLMLAAQVWEQQIKVLMAQPLTAVAVVLVVLEQLAVFLVEAQQVLALIIL
jgi:hypothetical protein